MTYLVLFLSIVSTVFCAAPGSSSGGGGGMGGMPPIPPSPSGPPNMGGGGMPPNPTFNVASAPAPPDYTDNGGAGPIGPTRPTGPTQSVQRYAKPLYRGLIRPTLHFFMHSDNQLVLRKTGLPGMAGGKVIPVEVYDRERSKLDVACPLLVELFHLEKDGAEFLVTDPKEIEMAMKNGFVRVGSIGMCVRKDSPRACGSTTPLLAAVRRPKIDYAYFPNQQEMNQFTSTKRNWRGSGRGPVCYIWS